MDSDAYPSADSALQLQYLQRKVAKLLAAHEQLREQNKAMRLSEAQWQAERAKLLQQNEMARQKVNDMIQRLQTLERNSG
ncbi:TIGR02449 family protein [Bacterioplanes sanyensis]|uniref:TIGR02449 family protein n=1 Tax=Bacterioplanes sanyensis TaxID=1249553 RepID=A0A222FGL2_9GAMM|nr:TIGR02449 family protein [Bacterioplanes sanyensis]ASP37762.1 TIGR02449 family protein [Bacterioplanes sanyensis]